MKLLMLMLLVLLDVDISEWYFLKLMLTLLLNGCVGA